MAVAIFSGCLNILFLSPTIYMLQVYDRVVPTRSVEALVNLSVIIFIALLSLSILDWLRARILMRASLKLEVDVSRSVIIRAFGSRYGNQSSRFVRDLDEIRNALGGQGVIALFDAPWTPIFLVCCFLLHWAIGVLALVGAALMMLLAWRNQASIRLGVASMQNAANAAHSVQEAMAAHTEIIRSLGMRSTMARRQESARRQVADHQLNVALTGSAYASAIKFSRLALQSAALGLAGYLVIGGHMTPGAIVASSLLLSRAVAPVGQLVAAWPGLVKARASWRSLIALFESTDGADRVRTSLPPPDGRLQVENVTVRLGPSALTQLKRVSLTLEPGKVLGVIGPSGSGKTTLARVITGGVTPMAGSVRLGGAEYGAYDGDVLARHIGYLPQNPILFPGSISENISRFDAAIEGRRDDIDEMVISAAKTAGVHDIIQQMPQGYDTRLGPFGTAISAGQAQRLALARALYGDPVLLVLDEPNSSLDQEGEHALREAIRFVVNRAASVFLIAHRTGILAQADRLLVMNSGAVQAQGPRDEIVRLIDGRQPLVAGCDAQ